MDYKNEILAFLEKEEETLVRAWENAKDARDRAPSAAESHSDTTRSEQEKLVHALERDIKILRGYVGEVGKMVKASGGGIGQWSVVELDNGGSIMQILLVPEGIGGKEVRGLRLVSIGSALGMALIGKMAGDSVEINGRRIVVRGVE